MASFAATVSALFSKIIAFFISILIMLFPNATIDLQQQRENNINNWIPVIEEAIINKDTDQTMRFLCESLQQDPETSKKVQTIYSFIIGDVTSIDWAPSASFSGEGISGGGYNLTLKTNESKSYQLSLGWMLVNVAHPEATKCVEIYLSPILPDGSKGDSIIWISESSDSNKTETEWMINLVDAFGTRNMPALEETVCENIRANTPQLTDKIADFFSCIEGDITSIDCVRGVTWGLGGDEVLQTRFAFLFWTTEAVYVVEVDWQEENANQPEYIGLNGLYLQRSDKNGSEKLFYIASDNNVEQKYVAEWLSE